MKTWTARMTAAVLAGIVLTVVTACSGPGDSGSADAARTSGTDAASKIPVVASTNVWGDIAQTVGGQAVEVTSIISDPSADPHAYEASTSTALKVSKAAVVIENGGGYDDFMQKLLSTSGNKKAITLNAVEVSGKARSDGDDLNEHVWYDLPTVQKVADELAAAFGRIAPAEADRFDSNARNLTSQLGELRKREATMATSQTGKGVAITEPVPVYLLEACGLVNQTPEEFSEAIEEGADVPARVMAQTLELFTQKKVNALVYNAQTSGPQTSQVREEAERAGVPTVPVAETLPAGKSYTTWMSDNLTAIEKALAS